MNPYQRERKLEEKNTELRRTIQFLCTTIDNVREMIDSDPALAKMILKDALDDKRYEFR